MKFLIKNGEIIDGTGQKPFRADIAIDDNIIVEIGSNLAKTSRKVIDAADLTVSPGFIDSHTHTDQTIFETPKGDSKILQGITTEIIGNCGTGPFPVSTKWKKDLEDYLDTLSGSLPQGLQWTDFEGFGKAVQAINPGINLAGLTAHGALRIAAMGAEDRPPTASELQEMRKLLDTSLKQGSWGMSTGLIYPPGSFAATDELAALGKVLAKHNCVFTSHVRGESATLLEAVDEVIGIGKKTGAPILISHLKAIGKPYWGSALEALKNIEAARQIGLTVWADQYPYEATATALSVLVPGWAHDGGISELVKRLSDDSLKDRLLKEIAEQMEIRGGPECVKVSVVKTSKNQCHVGKSIHEIAATLQISPAETVMLLLIEENAAVNAVYFSLGEDDLKGIIVSPIVAIGSDGYAYNIDKHKKQNVHPRSYGTFPRVLGRFVREEKLLSLEAAIWKMTGLPAKIFGIADRGKIAVGYKADITVFDPATINDPADFIKPHQYPVGINCVLVNGTMAVNKGKITGDGKGLFLKKSPVK